MSLSLTCLCWSKLLSSASKAATSFRSLASLSPISWVLHPGPAPLWQSNKTKLSSYFTFIEQVKVYNLIPPLYAVFALLFYKSDAFQYICNIINSPFLSDGQCVGCLKTHITQRSSASNFDIFNPFLLKSTHHFQIQDSIACFLQ